MIMCYPVLLIQEVCLLPPKTLAMQFNWFKRRLYSLESNKKGVKDKVKETLERGTWKTRAWNSRIQMRVEAGSKSMTENTEKRGNREDLNSWQV